MSTDIIGLPQKHAICHKAWPRNRYSPTHFSFTTLSKSYSAQVRTLPFRISDRWVRAHGSQTPRLSNIFPRASFCAQSHKLLPGSISLPLLTPMGTTSRSVAVSHEQ